MTPSPIFVGVGNIPIRYCQSIKILSVAGDLLEENEKNNQRLRYMAFPFQKQKDLPVLELLEKQKKRTTETGKELNCYYFSQKSRARASVMASKGATLRERLRIF